MQDPASQRLKWHKKPLTVLVIKKVRDRTVMQPFVRLTNWLVLEKRMLVYVEQGVLEDPALVEDPDFKVGAPRRRCRSTTLGPRHRLR